MKLKDMIFILIVFIIMCYYGSTREDADCIEAKIFYESKINCKIVLIDTFDYKTKGKGIFYYFSSNKRSFFYKSTNYLHREYPEMYIEDSISKEKKTEDFKLFRNGILIYNGKGLFCNCKFCD
jgi:hypothetical protein